MSTYSRDTKHPVTGKWENATWFDDLFGNHHYGVVFPSDREKYGKDLPLRTIAFDPQKMELETREKEE
jgi:hypothetical protein